MLKLPVLFSLVDIKFSDFRVMSLFWVTRPILEIAIYSRVGHPFEEICMSWVETFRVGS